MSTAYGGQPTGLSGTHFGGVGLGVLGSLAPSSGTSGPSPLFELLSLPADAASEFMFRVTTVPAGLTSFNIREDSSFDATGSDGQHVGAYTLYSGGQALFGDSLTLTFGTPPSITGTIAATQQPGTAAMTGSVDITGHLAATQAANTAAMLGRVISPSAAPVSFLYPRVLKITRPQKDTGVGVQPYGGATISTETLVVAHVQASIQQKKEGSAPSSGLPGDTVKRTFWRIFVPLSALADGVIQTHDIVTDDLGVRYQVMAPYWNSLGYNLLAERLES